MVLAPGKVSSIALDEEVLVLALAVVLVALANVYLLRRVVGPVQALDCARPAGGFLKSGPAHAGRRAGL